MPISLGFWEWGCPKRGDAHITVTLVCQAGGSLFQAFRQQSAEEKFTNKKKKRAEPERQEQAKREAAGSNPGGTNTQGLFMRRKCYLCNNICKRLDFLVFPDKDDKLQALCHAIIPVERKRTHTLLVMSGGRVLLRGKGLLQAGSNWCPALCFVVTLPALANLSKCQYKTHAL